METIVRKRAIVGLRQIFNVVHLVLALAFRHTLGNQVQKHVFVITQQAII
jgi:hypothetical protein